MRGRVLGNYYGVHGVGVTHHKRQTISGLWLGGGGVVGLRCNFHNFFPMQPVNQYFSRSQRFEKYFS